MSDPIVTLGNALQDHEENRKDRKDRKHREYLERYGDAARVADEASVALKDRSSSPGADLGYPFHAREFKSTRGTWDKLVERIRGRKAADELQLVFQGIVRHQNTRQWWHAKDHNWWDDPNAYLPTDRFGLLAVNKPGANSKEVDRSRFFDATVLRLGGDGQLSHIGEEFHASELEARVTKCIDRVRQADLPPGLVPVTIIQGGGAVHEGSLVFDPAEHTYTAVQAWQTAGS